MTQITYSVSGNVTPSEIECLFDAADFPGPDGRFSLDEIVRMLDGSDVVVTARAEAKLVGIALSLTNRVSVCYLSAFAVHRDFQRLGIGAELVRRSHQEAGGETLSLVSISTPGAIPFYERIGMERCRNGFIIPRKRS